MKTEAAKTAQRIRIELKEIFPGIKFKVISQNYSMGNSVNVSWIDGPIKQEVKKIIDKYQIGYFDAMIDSYKCSNIRADIPQVRHVSVDHSISGQYPRHLANKIEGLKKR